MARAAREISSSHDLAVRRRITASTLPAEARAGQSTLVYGKSPSVGIGRGLDRRRLDAVLQQTTIVPTPWWVRTLVWLCLPAVGAALVLLLIGVLVWLPLPGPFNLLRDLPDDVATITGLAVGGILGLILAVLVDRESLTVRITTSEVVLTRPGSRRTVPRGEIAVAFKDRDQLILLGRTGKELAHEPCHLGKDRLQSAFAGYGIAWSDQDPYADAYRRWVPDLPDLPASANAVFAARQKAVEAGDDADKQELREELGRLGFVVRDQRKRQYWRRVDG
jgi:hypothetical protein